MGIEAWLSLTLLSVILSLVLALYLQCRKCWRLLTYWRQAPVAAQPVLNRHDQENRELKSALRAKEAHVEQLLRKVELLQALVPGA